MQKILLNLALWILLTGQAHAHITRTLDYKGPSRLSVVWIARGEITTIVFPGSITKVLTTVMPDQINHVIDGRRLILNTLERDFKTLITVETNENRRYDLQLWTKNKSTVKNKRHDFYVTLTDTKHLADETEPLPMEPAAHSSFEKYDPIRTLILAMLHPERPLPPGVTVKSLETKPDKTSEFTTQLLRAYEAPPYFGHTEMIVNLTESPWGLNVSRVSAPGLVAITATVKGTEDKQYLPAEAIPAHGSALVYKIYKKSRH